MPSLSSNQRTCTERPQSHHLWPRSLAQSFKGNKSYCWKESSFHTWLLGDQGWKIHGGCSCNKQSNGLCLGNFISGRFVMWAGFGYYVENLETTEHSGMGWIFKNEALSRQNSTQSLQTLPSTCRDMMTSVSVDRWYRWQMASALCLETPV